MRDNGRRVMHLGEWYLWIADENGRLGLHRIERLNAAVREVADALRTALAPTSAE